MAIYCVFCRNSTENWQFSVYFVIIYAFFRCKFYSSKNFARVKKMTNMRYPRRDVVVKNKFFTGVHESDSRSVWILHPCWHHFDADILAASHLPCLFCISGENKHLFCYKLVSGGHHLCLRVCLDHNGRVLEGLPPLQCKLQVEILLLILTY